MSGTRAMTVALAVYISAVLLFITANMLLRKQSDYVMVQNDTPLHFTSVTMKLSNNTRVNANAWTEVVKPVVKTTENTAIDNALPEYQSVVCQSAPQSFYPFCDSSLDFVSRTNDLLGRLTLAEVIGQTSTIAPAISRLGINAYNWRSNCLHGWSKSGGNWLEKLYWTVFPSPISLGATFDTTLLHSAGKITSDEGRALHNVMLQNYTGETTEAAGLNCFSPNVNLFRDPRWGRGQETYGEDPYLLSMLGVAYTRGLQEGTDRKYLKVAACAKHYAVHSGPEDKRLGFVANVSLYELYDTYLPAFQSQVLAAKVAQMMPAYSGVRIPGLSDDGAPDCANKHLLKTILREELKAPNISVCSDNGGVWFLTKYQKFVNSDELGAAVSMNATTDLDLGHDNIFPDHLQNAVDHGLVEEKTIREAVWRSFYLRMRLGDFDPPLQVAYQSISHDHLDTADNQAVNLEAAIKSIVLLKNSNYFLPLLPTALKKVAIIGPNIDAASLSNYEGIPSKIVTVEEGITAALGSDVSVSSAKGCTTVKCPHKTGFVEARDAVEGADCVFMVMGLGQPIEKESRDRVGYPCRSSNRSAIGLPGCQHDLISYIEEVNDKIVLILLNGGPLTIVEEDQSDKVRAIVEAFYPGPLGGAAVAKILFGEVSPAGRMPVMVVESDKDVPPSVDYNMATNPGRTYRYFTKPVLYPFGYGLSYTTFDYSGLTISPKTILPCESVVVSVEVQNTGRMDSDEVVQLYLTTPTPPGAHVRPHYNLVGFNRAFFTSGTGTIIKVQFTINAYLMTSVTPKGNRVIVPGSDFVVQVGNASPQKSNKTVTLLKDQFTVTGSLTDITSCPSTVPQCLAC